MYIGAYVFVYIYISFWLCVYLCVFMHIFVYMWVCRCVFIFVYMLVFVCVNILFGLGDFVIPFFVYVYICVYVYMSFLSFLTLFIAWLHISTTYMYASYIRYFWPLFDTPPPLYIYMFMYVIFLMVGLCSFIIVFLVESWWVCLSVWACDC